MRSDRSVGRPRGRRLDGSGHTPLPCLQRSQASAGRSHRLYLLSRITRILLRKCGPKGGPKFLPTMVRARARRILLAKSPEQNLCGKICSHHGAKLDENRTSTLTNSTIMQSIGCICRLVVISPTVSTCFPSGSGRAGGRGRHDPGGQHPDDENHWRIALNGPASRKLSCSGFSIIRHRCAHVERPEQFVLLSGAAAAGVRNRPVGRPHNSPPGEVRHVGRAALLPWL